MKTPSPTCTAMGRPRSQRPYAPRGPSAWRYSMQPGGYASSHVSLGPGVGGRRLLRTGAGPRGHQLLVLIPGPVAGRDRVVVGEGRADLRRGVAQVAQQVHHLVVADRPARPGRWPSAPPFRGPSSGRARRALRRPRSVRSPVCTSVAVPPIQCRPSSMSPAAFRMPTSPARLPCTSPTATMRAAASGAAGPRPQQPRPGRRAGGDDEART